MFVCMCMDDGGYRSCVGMLEVLDCMFMQGIERNAASVFSVSSIKQTVSELLLFSLHNICMYTVYVSCTDVSKTLKYIFFGHVHKCTLQQCILASP